MEAVLLPLARAGSPSCTLQEQNVLPNSSRLLKAEIKCSPAQGRAEQGALRCPISELTVVCPSTVIKAVTTHPANVHNPSLFYRFSLPATSWQSRDKGGKRHIQAKKCTLFSKLSWKFLFAGFFFFFSSSLLVRQCKGLKKLKAPCIILSFTVQTRLPRTTSICRTHQHLKSLFTARPHLLEASHLGGGEGPECITARDKEITQQ